MVIDPEELFYTQVLLVRLYPDEQVLHWLLPEVLQVAQLLITVEQD